jgi:hypothetical protein
VRNLNAMHLATLAAAIKELLPYLGKPHLNGLQGLSAIRRLSRNASRTLSIHAKLHFPEVDLWLDGWITRNTRNGLTSSTEPDMVGPVR